MSKYDLPLEEISENITDTILKEKYLERGSLIKKITTLLKVHFRIKNKPKKQNNRTATTEKLQWTVAKNKQTQEQKVKEFIKQNRYSWTYSEIMEEYNKWKTGSYISFTAKKVINACIDSSCQVYH